MHSVRENKVGAAHPTLVLVGVRIWGPHWSLTDPIGKQTLPPGTQPWRTHRPDLVPLNTSPAPRQELGTAGSRKVLSEFLSGIYALSSTPIQVSLLPEWSSHSFPPHRTGNTERDPHIPVGRARATAPPTWTWQMSVVCGGTGTGILRGGNGAVLPTPGRRDFCRNKLNPPD